MLLASTSYFFRSQDRRSLVGLIVAFFTWVATACREVARADDDGDDDVVVAGGGCCAGS